MLRKVKALSLLAVVVMSTCYLCFTTSALNKSMPASGSGYASDIQSLLLEREASTHSPLRGSGDDEIDSEDGEEQEQEQEQKGDDNGYYSSDMRVDDLWNARNCDSVFKNERPIHSQSAWEEARALYRDIVGENSSIGQSDENESPNGFSVAVEAKQSPPKGRGIFAVNDIAAGELIWSTAKTARFQDGPSYRKFIFRLEEGFACDVLQWAYVQDIGDGDYRVSVDLDEGSFCNNGGGDEANKGCDEDAATDVEGGCQNNYFALRDIEAGEELQCSYGQFAVSGGWKMFDL